MGACESSCKPCNPGNPVTDTVKFDGTLLQQLLASESPKPAPAQDEPEQNPESPKELPEDEQKRREEEERLENERREEEDRQNRLEQERIEAEERRRRDEEEERKCKEVEDAQRVMEAAKVKVEAKRAGKAKKEAAKTKVDAWLKARGFKNLKDPKKPVCCGAPAFAFHTAIEAGDSEMVRAMLLCDADPNLKNSSGKMAHEVAERCGNAEVLEAFNK